MMMGINDDDDRMKIAVYILFAGREGDREDEEEIHFPWKEGRKSRLRIR